METPNLNSVTPEDEGPRKWMEEDQTETESEEKSVSESESENESESESETDSELLSREEQEERRMKRRKEDAAIRKKYWQHLYGKFCQKRERAFAHKGGWIDKKAWKNLGSQYTGERWEEEYGWKWETEASITRKKQKSRLLAWNAPDSATLEARAWYEKSHDAEPLPSNDVHQNSLMGWNKGADGKWSQGGDAPVAAPAPKAMGEGYKGEQRDARRIRGAASSWSSEATTPGATVEGVNTHYLDADEQQKATVQMQDGKLLGADGQKIDTREATGKGTLNDAGKGRFIFNKDTDGTLRALDPWANHKETQRDDWLDAQRGRISGRKGRKERDPTEIQMSFINHSSLNRGGESRGAGELVVEEGDVKMVTDNSGHYETDNTMMYDTVQGLADAGANTEGMTVGFVDKEMTNEQRNARLRQIRLDREETNGRGLRFGALFAGANEFLAYGGAEDAEKQMRTARKQRNPMFRELQKKTAGTRNSLDKEAEKRAIAEQERRRVPAKADPKKLVKPKKTVKPDKTIEPKEAAKSSRTVKPREKTVKPEKTIEPKEAAKSSRTVKPREKTVQPKRRIEPKEAAKSNKMVEPKKKKKNVAKAALSRLGNLAVPMF